MFQVTSHKWHRWSDERKVDSNKKFREYNPTISETFTMLANSGRKPSFKQCKRNNSESNIVIDRSEPDVPSKNQSFDETIGYVQSFKMSFSIIPERQLGKGTNFIYVQSY